MASSDRPPTENQLSDLPGPVTYITGHSPDGKSIVQSTRPVKWARFDEDRLGMSVAYTTKFPADVNNDADIRLHDEKMKSPLGLVSTGGTVLRFVEFAPGYECAMHRTQSLDYGIVLEGEVVGILDGEECVLKKGDVMVQRATMHAWRNDSKTEWARMIFSLQDCQPVFSGGERLGENLGKGEGELPPSGNDS